MLIFSLTLRNLPLLLASDDFSQQLAQQLTRRLLHLVWNSLAPKSLLPLQRELTVISSTHTFLPPEVPGPSGSVLSEPGLCVEDLSKATERSQGDPRRLLLPHRVALNNVEHPDGHHASRLVRKGDHSDLRTACFPALEDLYFLTRERMVAIGDDRRGGRRAMSSVTGDRLAWARRSLLAHWPNRLAGRDTGTTCGHGT